MADQTQFGMPDAGMMGGSSFANFAQRRQEARFAQMSGEVKGLMKSYPGALENSDLGDIGRDLRRKGFDAREEKAIIGTFLTSHAYRPPAYAEGQIIPGNSPVVSDMDNMANPPTPRSDAPNVNKFVQDFWNWHAAAGRLPQQTGYQSRLGTNI